MRCIICDVSSSGLSYFNPDRALSTSFHEHEGDLLCSECYEGYSSVMDDFFLEDTLGEDEEID